MQREVELELRDVKEVVLNATRLFLVGFQSWVETRHQLHYLLKYFSRFFGFLKRNIRATCRIIPLTNESDDVSNPSDCILKKTLIRRRETIYA